jgi:hypothetical protein
MVLTTKRTKDGTMSAKKKRGQVSIFHIPFRRSTVLLWNIET